MVRRTNGSLSYYFESIRKSPLFHIPWGLPMSPGLFINFGAFDLPGIDKSRSLGVTILTLVSPEIPTCTINRRDNFLTSGPKVSVIFQGSPVRHAWGYSCCFDLAFFPFERNSTNIALCITPWGAILLSAILAMTDSVCTSCGEATIARKWNLRISLVVIYGDSPIRRRD